MRSTHIHGTPAGLRLTKVNQHFRTLTEFITCYGWVGVPMPAKGPRPRPLHAYT